MRYLSEEEKAHARRELQENGKAAQDVRQPYSRGVSPRIKMIRDDQEQADSTPEPEL